VNTIRDERLFVGWPVISWRNLARLSGAVMLSVAVTAGAAFAEGAKGQAATGRMARPGEISLGVLERSESLSSPLGAVDIRWARSAEVMFGTSPERAVLESMRAVKRTLYSLGIDQSDLGDISRWEMVFVDKDLKSSELPRELLERCHPAWMTPPSNLYFVANRIAGGCSGKELFDRARADAEMTEVILHEIGHVIEYMLLKKKINPDVPHAEGFATWFTSVATDYTPFFRRGQLKREQLELAAVSAANGVGAGGFKGTENDYVVASLPYHAVYHRLGAQGIKELYRELEAGAPMLEALEQGVDWSPVKLKEEIINTLNKRS